MYVKKCVKKKVSIIKQIQLSRKQIKQRKIKEINYYYAVITHNKVKKTFYAKTVKELQEKYKNWVQENEKDIENTDTVLNHFIAFKKAKENIIKPTSLVSYTNVLNYIEKDKKFSNIKLNKLTENDIYNFFNKINLKLSSKQLYLNILKSFLNYYVRRDILTKNVANRVILKNFEVEEERNKYVSKEIREQILNDIKRTDKECPVILMIKCGLRLGEAVAICNKDLIEPNKLKINKTRNDLGKDSKMTKVITTPKNKTSNRVIIITEDVYNIVKNTKKPYSDLRVNLYRFLKKNYNVSPHDLRHSFITDCIQNEVNINVLKQYVGHAPSSKILETTYLHLQNDFIEQEVNKMFKD